ncbi:MAG TPA: hypothetical protein VNZ52_11915 [Candidatus Thermoplasmatota archaeon]|nr:hypothetical protein [Candidatus Thermoplasmatota archaeon]
MRTLFLLCLVLGLVPAAAAVPAAVVEEPPLCLFNRLHWVDRDAVPAGERYAYRVLTACEHDRGHVYFGNTPIPVTFVRYPAVENDLGVRVTEIQFALPAGTPLGTYTLVMYLYLPGPTVRQTQLTVDATVTAAPVRSTHEVASPGTPALDPGVRARTYHEGGVLCIEAGTLTRCTVPDGNRVENRTFSPGLPGTPGAIHLVLDVDTRAGGPDTARPDSSQGTEYRARLRLTAAPLGLHEDRTVHPARATELLA